MAYYAGQIEQQKRILGQVQNALPTVLAKQARHCLIKGKTLLIYTDSAIWATQLRFYKQAILTSVAKLSREPAEIIQIKIMTEPTGPSMQVTRTAKIPSATTIAIIRNDGLGVSDNQLKQALLNLSSTLERLSDAR